MPQKHTKSHCATRSGRKATPVKQTVVVDGDALRLQGLVTAYSRNLAALPKADGRKPALRKALGRAKAQLRAAQLRAARPAAPARVVDPVVAAWPW